MTALVVAALALAGLIALAFYLGRAVENTKQAEQSVSVSQEVLSNVQSVNQAVRSLSIDDLRAELLNGMPQAGHQ